MRKRNKGIFIFYISIVIIIIMFALPLVFPQMRSNLTYADKAYLENLGTIIAVGDEVYPPFGFVENGQPEGYEKDLVEALSEVLGVEIEYKPTLWVEAQETLLKGDAHILTGMRITADRKEEYDFTDPYLLTSFSIITTHDINGIEELGGKRVVVQEGSNTVRVLDDVNTIIIAVPSPLVALDYLNKGLADAWIENHQVATYYLNKSTEATFTIRANNSPDSTYYRVISLQNTSGDYAIAVNKDYRRLTSILNKALLQLKNEGKLDSLDLKWFGLTMARDTGNSKMWLSILFLSFVSLTVGCLLISYNEILRYNVNQKTKELKDQNDKLTNFTLNTAQAFGKAIEFKDIYTGGHSQRVAEISNVIGDKIGLDKGKLFQLYLGALIHDVGKVGIPDEILKKPGKLTDEEYSMIKEHPKIGDNILSHLEDYEYIRQIVLYHHERYDGKKDGNFAAYPGKLKGEAIPLAARIVSIADSYDAMTSDRPYRKALDKEEAKRRILSDAGKQFDPYLVSVFMKILDQHKDI